MVGSAPHLARDRHFVLLLDGHVHGVSLYGETCCLDGDTGQRVWTTLRPTSGGTEPRERWNTLFMVPQGDRGS